MLSSQLRGVLKWPEFDRDVLLSLDWPFVQQGGRVTPLANGFRGGRKKSGGTAQELYLLHLAKLPDRGAHPDGFSKSIAIRRPSITWPAEGDKVAGFQSSRPVSQCRPGRPRNENGELRGHR